MDEEKLAGLEQQLTPAGHENGPNLAAHNKSKRSSQRSKKLSKQKEKQKMVKKQHLSTNNPSQQLLNRLLLQYQNGRYKDAEELARSMTQEFPKHQFAWSILGAVLRETDRRPEAAEASQIAVSLSPQDAEVHNNLGTILDELGRLVGAEASYSRAIRLRPTFAEAHYNLGNTLQKQDRLDDAASSYAQAIALKPDLAGAHTSLGDTFQELGRLDEAKASYKRAIALKHNHALAHYGLGKVFHKTNNEDSALETLRRASAFDPKSKDILLLLNYLQAKKDREDAKSGVANTLPQDCLRLSPSEILKLERPVEQELIVYLYSKELRELDKEKDPSFGDTKGTKYELFEDSHPTIQKLAKDLKSVLMKEFNSDIFIKDSFASIFGAGGGTVRHHHVTKHDEDPAFSLDRQKYSLVYYLSIGDQGCSEPGFLKLYDPNEEILPSKGLILIFPADRYHSSSYSGDKDRVIIGVNFYTLQ